MQSIVVFYDPQFPMDNEQPNTIFIDRLFSSAKIVNANELASVLEDDSINCLVNLHGSYFPKAAWDSIYQFLSQGKGLVHVGGIPFRIPCYLENGKWLNEREQTAYHMQLNIHEALPVKSAPIQYYQHNEDIPVFSNKEDLFTIQDTCNFILHVTKKSTIPAEMGSVGPMDAKIYPLLKGVAKSGREVAAPAVLIENANGKFKGGRWLFINQLVDAHFWTNKGLSALIEFSNFVSNGVTDMTLKTNYATFEEGERARISFQLQSTNEQVSHWDLHFTIMKNEKLIFSKSMNVLANNQLNIHSFVVPIDITPGFYQVTCKATSDCNETRVLHQGFWGLDKELLQSGEPMTCDRDYFQKDGQPLPIVGMTYMTSDVSRYFLFLPNPAIWDKDMEQMKKAGINYLRTGIWTAWRNMMFADGHVEENILRAIDAFILCAKKHHLEVTFNFFSFTPELWDGENPYLDPRSIEAQKRFIASVVSRHKETSNINWDLINEPSLFDPERTFSGPRSLHDSFERKAFQKWLKNKYSSIRELQEKWNMTEHEILDFNRIEPPEQEDINFSIRDMRSGKKGLQWLDYTLFTIDMFNQWARELTDTIKQIAPNQLVTVGQDEALGDQRPTPFFYEEAVDYTTNHSWWLLDQLVWDGIFTKTPNKPNLIQETGIMYVENPNNIARRSEEELRNILERKYAYAFSTGGAGAVHWLWNTNYFMDNANESSIGALRADGTEKPETDVSYNFGEFIKKTRKLFTGRELEEVVVVFPYSNDFSNRKMAFDATTKLTRVLAYEMNVPFRAVGEYQLTSLKTNQPKLIIVPSAHNFTKTALDELMHFVEENGATLLFTGPISLDEFWGKTDRVAHFIGETKIENVLREEMLTVGDGCYPVSFGGERVADAMKEFPVDSCASSLHEYRLGKGRLLWSSLPVELNERNEPIIALYRYALEQARISDELHWQSGNVPGIYGRKLTFANGDLFVFVSEYGQDLDVKVTNPVTRKTYTFTLEKERSVLFFTDKNGKITGVYRPDEVTVEVE
ncbi:beta-galactosidase [Bacillus kwashiorkori]|uniref:beta-galactosidase n=1 Tax=Bacillus kwashiorkori TaxID=1522318 RepID=UPI000785BB9D|nr:beta-galactosidase [Bacillus kwashiorkori]